MNIRAARVVAALIIKYLLYRIYPFIIWVENVEPNWKPILKNK